jgi:hypothetical protein
MNSPEIMRGFWPLALGTVGSGEFASPSSKRLVALSLCEMTLKLRREDGGIVYGKSRSTNNESEMAVLFFGLLNSLDEVLVGRRSY